MLHRHLNHQRFTLAAIDDVISRGRWGDWAELRRAALADQSLLKIFHFARFDVGTLFHALGVMPQPVYCTKIASRLTRTYTDRHGLKDLVREVLNIDLSKQQQSSDWGSSSLSEAQLAYAASDVLHLHGLRERLDAAIAGGASLSACSKWGKARPPRPIMK